MEKFLKTLKIRVIVSVVCIAMFVVLGAVYAAQWVANMSSIPVTICLLAGYLLLPRRTLPSGFVPDKDSATDAELVTRMSVLQKNLVYARGVYFVIGVVVLFGFPSVF